MKHLTFLASAILWVTPAFAQLVEPNQVGVRMGHVHLAVKDVDAQKQFWTSVMGGTLVKNGPLELIQFPGVFIMLRQAESAAPPAGSIVEHFGFIVKDMPGALARWKAANVQIEPTENPNEVYVVAPDGIRVEVYGEPAVPTPVSMNHIHFYPADIPGIKAWYVKAFGANPGRRPCIACLSSPRMIEADDLPGVNLSFSPGHQAAPAHQGTLDRSHRLRGEQSRSVRQQPRSERDKDRSAHPAGSQHQGEDRVSDRSLGHLYRTDRRPRALANAAPWRMRSVSIASANMAVRHGADGIVYLQSRHPLGAYPVRLTERLEYWADRAADRAFLAQRDPSGRWRSLTYAETLGIVRRVSQALLARRLSSDRPLLILSGNSIEHALLALAAMHTGVLYAPIAPAYSLQAREYGTLGQIFDRVNPALVFAAEGASYEAALRSVLPSGTELIVSVVGAGRIARHAVCRDREHACDCRRRRGARTRWGRTRSPRSFSRRGRQAGRRA